MFNYLKTINHFDYCKFRERVIAECNISAVAWYKWSKGGPISEKYKPIINRIALEMFGKNVFNNE